MSEAELKAQTLSLAQALGSITESSFELLYPAAFALLKERLKPDTDPLDECAEVFPLAAALLVLELAESGESSASAQSFTAGSVSISGGSSTESTSSRWSLLERLLKPWLEDEGFAFLGVRG